MKTAAKHGKIIMAEQSTDGMCSCIFSIPLKVMMYMREIMGGGGGGGWGPKPPPWKITNLYVSIGIPV